MKIVDPANLIDSGRLDGMRSELGTCWRISEEGLAVEETSEMCSNKLDPNKTVFSQPSVNDILLFPEITQTVTIVGYENEFPSHLQWRDFVLEKINLDKDYNDHYFEFDKGALTHEIHKNFHNAEYEDHTKVYNTNLLLNLNLMNYKFNSQLDEFTAFASGLVTRYDLGPQLQIGDAPANLIPRNTEDVERITNEYRNRLENYYGDPDVLSRRQRNIFKLTTPTEHHLSLSELKQCFPYFLEMDHYQSQIETLDFINDMFQAKLFFQSIKQNIAFSNNRYQMDGLSERIRTHDLIDFILNQDVSQFIVQDDEMFLLEEDDLHAQRDVNRFVNQVRRVLMLERLQDYIGMNLRDYEGTINSFENGRASKKYHLGYKVEKYLRNDVTLPTQTFYIKNLSDFVDSQLKFGEKYIYHVKQLVMVLGSNYVYDNLLITDEQSRLAPVDGGTLTTLEHSTDKFKARFNVTVRPSFKIFELNVGEIETAFMDEQPAVPEVVFYNVKGQNNSIKIYLKSNLNDYYDSEEFIQIVDSDQIIQEQLRLSADPAYGLVNTNKYTIGSFEIYRMDHPPTAISDFAAFYLTEVDQGLRGFYHDGDKPENSHSFSQENLDAFYDDDVMPNKKYYYLFRSLSYHNTPSNPTVIYCVELIQDSDETKLLVEEYQIPTQKDYEYTKKMKRFMKITPNLEQLLFDGDNEPQGLTDIGALERKLFPGPNITKKFKIRITSKHTGKKMDINVTFKINNQT